MKVKLRQAFSFCQKGLRTKQEDARYPDSDRPDMAGLRCFAVCDGVGGLDKGEVASRAVADALGQAVDHSDHEAPFTPDQFSAALDAAFMAVQKLMEPDSTEMATTMTFLYFHGNGAFVAHMGDSRIYHIRPGVGILYRSDDHSLVNALVHSGNLTPQQAIDHPQSNIITRCIGYVSPGAQRPAATTLNISDIEPGDYFFLCSDGVTHCLDDRKLETIICDVALSDPEKIAIIARSSVDSPDNNTAYLVAIDDVDRRPVATGATHAGPSGVSTEMLARPVEQAKEISAGRLSAVSRISGFIKSLFR
ncbi:MAG: serine/threonine-protein phosphatase [Bacteroides sp.]|nr:serine/threonine-protein phosphatase [Bacteroides sp.]